ncbi:MAG: fatty acid desaturase, partial [Mesorhizobium sp.]
MVDSMTGMNKRRSSTPAVEWPTVFLTLFCYGAWLATGFLLWPTHPLVALVALGFILALQS